MQGKAKHPTDGTGRSPVESFMPAHEMESENTIMQSRVGPNNNLLQGRHLQLKSTSAFQDQ